jgi:hypothetical protein
LGVPRYRRCARVEVEAGSRRWMHLAYSYLVLGGQVLALRGALVLPDYACLNSATGWAGIGLPKKQGVRGMVGSQVLIARPSAFSPTGARSGQGQGCSKAGGAGEGVHLRCSHPFCPLALSRSRAPFVHTAAGAVVEDHVLAGYTIDSWTPTASFVRAASLG